MLTLTTLKNSLFGVVNVCSSCICNFCSNFTFDTTKLKLLSTDVLYIHKPICFVGGKSPFLECDCSHPCSVLEGPPFFYLNRVQRKISFASRCMQIIDAVHHNVKVCI